MPPRLILASTSPYRRELLARLRLPFETVAPQVDESPLPAESPADTAARLAQAKARAVAGQLARQRADALVIGSDQTATLDGRLALGKPGNHERALAQLRAASGRSMHFHTALTLLRQADGSAETQVIETRVRFRRLDDALIEAYLAAERPYDCAGAAKAEGLGIALIEAIEGPDPSALIGLPLIALTGMLCRAGHPPLGKLQ